jgi:GNAT superfamily N-acetyltransferase
VGRALVNAIEQWARERGADRLSVTSAEHRSGAHAFYPACGFPYTGRRFSKSLD